MYHLGTTRYTGPKTPRLNLQKAQGLFRVVVIGLARVGATCRILQCGAWLWTALKKCPRINVEPHHTYLAQLAKTCMAHIGGASDLRVLENAVCGSSAVSCAVQAEPMSESSLGSIHVSPGSPKHQGVGVTARTALVMEFYFLSPSIARS